MKFQWPIGWPSLRLHCSSSKFMAVPGCPSMAMAILWHLSLASDSSGMGHR